MTIEELKEEFLAFGSNKKDHESLSEVNPLSLVLHDNDLPLFYDEIIGVTVSK